MSDNVDATPLHVVHLVNSFGTGGMEKGVATLIGRGSPDVRHTVICLTRSGESRHLLPAGTPLVEMRKKPGHSFRFLWRLSRQLRELRPDVLHTRNWAGMDGIVAARLAGLSGVVHGEHGWVIEDPVGQDPRRVRVRRFLARWVREYTCVSMQMEAWLRETISVVQPVTTIRNGVDTELYAPGDQGAAVRRELSIAPDAFVVGIVGRLDPIKDHDTLFRAFAELHARRPDSHLLVVGDGPQRARLEREAGPGVIFLGSRTDAPRLFQAMDLFALSSLNEGISNTILEAMASGLPTLVTDVGGNPELVADGLTGALVPVGDVGAMAEALSRYSSEPERRGRHGSAARARAVEEFSVAKMVAAYETVYRRVIPRAATG